MNPMVDTLPMMATVQGSGGGTIGADPYMDGHDGGSYVDVGGALSVNTHTRVAGMLLAAGGVLVLLRFAGFRFNVGVAGGR